MREGSGKGRERKRRERKRDTETRKEEVGKVLPALKKSSRKETDYCHLVTRFDNNPIFEIKRYLQSVSSTWNDFFS